MNVLSQNMRPLDGLVVLDFSQFLAGPLCSLKLADLGARVIKVERKGVGDLCRNLYLSDTDLDGDTTLFHAINRNKESIEVDMRDSADQKMLRQLLKNADVMIQNFRPGVIEQMGFGYKDVQALNPTIIYGSVSGYGESGPWVKFPGQDLLAQARSGMMWLNGRDGGAPQATGLALADMLAGHSLTQGILAGLVQRGIKGRGCLVQTSLLEAMLDFQFEVLSTHLNDGRRTPKRAKHHGAHAYLGSPYGIYETLDGYIALAMTPSISKLAQLLGIKNLDHVDEIKGAALKNRDEINATFAARLKNNTTQYWLDILQPEDIWCAEVMDWNMLLSHPAYHELDFEQKIQGKDGFELIGLRSPIRIDGQTLKSNRAAPKLGADQSTVLNDLLLVASEPTAVQNSLKK
ncbi:CoA transferase [Rhodobacteraceae bacterium]|nr:CoA transferase [Paracoccaceae bacterium]